MKILIAGFQHETNTFVTLRAHYENFINGETFPAMKRGDAVFELRDVNIPIGGFIREIEGDGHELVPALWAGAGPASYVSHDAFERITGEIVEAVRNTIPDAVYLDLHGAMVADRAHDGEGTILARVREAVGPDIPLIASVDLHANVTPKMLSAADALVAYRTYPHVDMADTGRRAARLLRARLAGERWHCAWRRLPFLIPINAMCTLVAPAKSAYEQLQSVEADGLVSLSFTPGFPAADFDGCGPMIWGYGADAAHVRRAVSHFAADLLDSEAKWAVDFMAPRDAVREALRLAALSDKPIVIADTQDNPGAGGETNTTAMLIALLAEDATEAAFGIVHDPDAAAAAHTAGLGATIAIALGGESGLPGGERFNGIFKVAHLCAGDCVFDGPMLNGMAVRLGPTALLQIGGVRVVVSTERPPQMMDRNLYRVAGVEPETMRILVNKSSVHFHADFDPIAAHTLIAKAPGAMLADPADLPWTRLAPGMRIGPKGKAFPGVWQEAARDRSAE